MFVQINDHFNINRLYYFGQNGFRNAYFTELEAAHFMDRTGTILDKRDILISIFIDLSKTFDTINHKNMLSKLKYYGFNEMTIALMESYLSGRQQYVEFENVKSNCLRIKTGVPQGSILGPLLVLIYILMISQVLEIF